MVPTPTARRWIRGFGARRGRERRRRRREPGGRLRLVGARGRGPPYWRRRRYYRKTMRPSSAQLAARGLRDGRNTITFTVHSALQGTQLVSSTVWQFGRATRLVVSDVDGTITKSDVLGQLMPRVGLDWAHGGVTSLYSQITKQGYQMLYLTARGIGMATTTRDYLFGAAGRAHAADRGRASLALAADRVVHARGHPAEARGVQDRRALRHPVAVAADAQPVLRRVWQPRVGRGGVPRGRRAAEPHPDHQPAGRDPPLAEALRVGVVSRLREIAQEMFPPVADAKGDDAVDDEFTAYNFWKMPIGAPPPVLETGGGGAEGGDAGSRRPSRRPPSTSHAKRSCPMSHGCDNDGLDVRSARITFAAKPLLRPFFDFAGFSRSVGASTIASSGTDRARRQATRGRRKCRTSRVGTASRGRLKV